MSEERLTLFARLKQAAKTDAEWKEIDPVIELGEEVYVIVHENPMTLSYKIGDGKSKYTELDFSLTQGEGIISYATSSVNIGYHTQAGTLGYRITDFHCNKENVTSVTIDDKGHATEVVTQNVTFTDSDTKVSKAAFTASASNNVATIKDTITLVNAVNGPAGTVEASYTVSSKNENLTVAASGSNVDLNFVWGTF
jgi:hypothetical protein